VGTALWRARALGGAGRIAWEVGDSARAEELLMASLGLYQEIGEEESVPSTLQVLADVAILRGDEGRARCLLEEALDLAQARGDQVVVAGVCRTRGWVAFRRGDYETASACYEASLQLARTTGFSRGEMLALNDLANVARHRRDLRRTRAFTRESLQVAARLRDRRGVAACLASLAAFAMAGGDAGRAAFLYGAADAHLDPIGLAAHVPSDRPDSPDNLPAVRAALGEAAFVAAWGAGRVTPLARVIAEELADEPAARTPTAPARTASPDQLTAREVEVLRLIAAGRSNREIAAELVVSVRTVEHHVAAIYVKTGTHRRAEAIAYARRHGLLAPDSSVDVTT
jgi:non-specific serine/threonine protein kinase